MTAWIKTLDAKHHAGFNAAAADRFSKKYFIEVPTNTHYICSTKTNYYTSYKKYNGMNDKKNTHYIAPVKEVLETKKTYYCAAYKVNNT